MGVYDKGMNNLHDIAERLQERQKFATMVRYDTNENTITLHIYGDFTIDEM